MTTLKFIIITWLASFIAAAYCETENYTSESNCTVELLQSNGDRTWTPIQEWQTKMITSCPENYKNEDIIKKCEHADSLQNRFDSALFSAVTNDIASITYLNKFCANCNNDNDTDTKWKWYFWDEYKTKNKQDACGSHDKKIQSSEVNELDKWTRTFISEGMTLKYTSYIDPFQKLQCSLNKKWPIKLLNHVIPCLVINIITGQHHRLAPCQYYEKNGRSCIKMEFIVEGYIFEYNNKFYGHLSEINLTGGDYIVQAGYDDLYYMCKQIYNPGYWGKFLLIVVSIAFLLTYLIINFDKRYFQTFLNQTLYVYSIGLMIIHVLITYIYLQFPVSYVTFHLAKIFWSAHFFWTVLIFSVYCQTACTTCNLFKNITEGATHKCCLAVVFIIGIILPISLLIIYLNALKTPESRCPAIADHLVVSNTPAENMQFLEVILGLSLSNLTPAIIVVVLICKLKDMPCGSEEDRPSVSTSNSLTAFAKMVLIVAIHWVLYKIGAGYFGHENSFTFIGLSINMDIIAQLSIDCHGVLVFFLILFHKSMINKVLNRYGCKSGNDTQQGDIGAPETGVQFLSQRE